MKKLTLLFAAFALLVGCGNQPKPANSPENPTEAQQEAFSVETYKIDDSRLLGIRGEGEDSYEVRASYQCEIDIPVTDNPTLYDSICDWFAYQFGSAYDGDPRDVKSLVNFYRDWALDLEDGEEIEGFDVAHTVKMEEANERYVTYSFDNFFETNSAPRAFLDKTYVTFDRKTGQRFTRQMLKADENLEQLVMNELLEQYFSDWSEEDLADLLFFDPEDLEERGFFLPEFNDPWILNNLVYFGYGEHEIADHCTGQPHCGLPYSTMKPFLTEEGQAFFK